MKSMRTLSGITALAAAVAVPQLAHADVITSATVSDGTNLTTFSTTSDDPIYPSGSSAALQSITAGGVTYTTLIGADGFVGDVEDVLFPVGGSGTLADASNFLSDLDLSTGALDPYGTGTFEGTEFWDFSSQTITDDTVFFLFNNATGVSDVALVDADGNDITNMIFRNPPGVGNDTNSGNPNLGTEVELNDLIFSRTGGDDLDNRDIAGNIFAVSEFAFNDGSSIDDVVGFRGSGGSFDALDAGIAIVPEPASLALLGLGSLVMLGRRKKA